MLKQLNEMKNLLTILLAFFFVAILIVTPLSIECSANDSSDCNLAVLDCNIIWEWGK
jgi:hypothetical protein